MGRPTSSTTAEISIQVHEQTAPFKSLGTIC